MDASDDEEATSATKLEAWADAYRAEAEADGFAKMAGWLEAQSYVDVQDFAPDAVEETIELVEVIVDVDDERGLLPLQVYDPTRARSRYVLSFQGGAHERARLYCDRLSDIDLAGLHDEGVGFQVLTIDHPDATPFAAGEHDELEEQLRADFADDGDDVDLAFSRGERWLQVEATDS